MEMPSKTELVKPSDAVRRVQPQLYGYRIISLALILSLALVGFTGLASSFGLLLIGAFCGAGIFWSWRSSKLAAGPAEGPSVDFRENLRDGFLLDSLPQPAMILDQSDCVVTANAACRETFGADVTGENFTSVIRAPSALAALREARHEGAAKEAEFSMASGDSLAALLHVAPVANTSADQDGQFIVMIRDRTEQKMLERTRTDFIANAGHELRTPLAALLGFIETLQGHAKNDPEAQERFLRIMQSQTERLLRLVQDLVSLSTLELNERRLPEDDVDLCEVAQVVHDLMDPVAKKANGVLQPVAQNCSAKVVGDRDQLIQVAQNLVDNALKYGATSGDQGADIALSIGGGAGLAFENADKSGDSPEQIAIRAGCDPSALFYLRVRDHGQGIPITDLPRLTERFYRTDVEKSHAAGGTGLGLAIVKHIVGRHRGGILVESQPGAGAAFTCYFPPLESGDSNAASTE